MKNFFRINGLFPAVISICLFLAWVFPTRTEGTENQARAANRRGTARMVAGETGSPPGPFGSHWVHLNQNAKVDSYDSRIGPYSESKGSKAIVGSNINPKDSEAGVRLDNNAIVRGDVEVTSSEEEGHVTRGRNSEVEGSILYDRAGWELLPLEMPGADEYTVVGGEPGGIIDGKTGKIGGYEITDNNFRAYNNAEVTFRSGTYHFDTFQLDNNVEFWVDPDIGPDETVDIYVESEISFDNNCELGTEIQITGDTTKLRFYFNGVNKVDISNNVTFYGVMYAPNAKIEVRNNDSVYGNLIGKQVYIWNNGAVHYDKALGDQDFGHIFTGGVPARPHERDEWREIIQ